VSERTQYPSGVPCWVDTLQRDPAAALAFYAEVFGWEFAGPGPMPGSSSDQYFVARLRGREVAGIGSLPPQQPPVVWNTYVSVDDAAAACERVRGAGGAVAVPPFDAPPAGRIAVVADPEGAVFCLWEPNERKGAQIVNEPSAWAMSALLARDPQRAAAFYRDAFGWETDTFAAGPTQVTLFRLPGYVGGEPQQPVPRDVVAVAIPAGDALPTGVNAQWSVDFWIADVDAAAQTAARHGGTLLEPPHDVPGFRRCVLADPQGAIFSLSRLNR
jgi:hypothetical protein